MALAFGVQALRTLVFGLALGPVTVSTARIVGLLKPRREEGHEGWRRWRVGL